ncbi:UDP-N-acetylmuramoyl-L-alanine--D-glutamate ligase [bacterium]|nr:UDP-N-acetylmuramoyl-L-alanine--D-glutamate ligase [bacterium]
MNYKDRRIAILGMGKSGLALAEELSRRGAKVFVSDAGSAEQLKEAAARLEKLGADYETGGHSDRVLDNEIIVISPGVSVRHPLIQKALAQGIKVLGEVEIAWDLSEAPFIAVTGTNGKSTTVTLIDRMLGSKSILAGNIGVPLVSEVGRAPAGGFVTAEISSFQLEAVDKFRPHIAVLTNITPDHLDRHPDLEEYFAAKARLFARMQSSDLAIFSADDPEAARMCALLREHKLPAWLPGFEEAHNREIPQIMTFSVKGPVERGAWYADGTLWYRDGAEPVPVVKWEGFAGLPGPHNIANALAAAAAAKYLHVDNGAIKAALAAHKPLHYRMEKVCTRRNVQFVNDSKATNVSSVIAAIDAYKDGFLALIAGGKDKGFDFDPLGRHIAAHCDLLLLIGEAGDRLEAAVKKFGGARIYRAASLKEAVEIGYKEAAERGGGTVLLSPACSSFDMFKNAEERGRLFSEYAEGIS